MGTKKLESGVISVTESQEEWDKLMKFSGLLVADIYQDWTGPCKPMVSLFNKLHTQLNHECIKFTQVKVDNVRSLQSYKGKSEPTFLLMGSGNLVGVVRGVNAPIMKELCLIKFEEELKVMNGEIERSVIRDPGIKRLESTDDTLAEDIYDFQDVEMTFAILKPDIVSKGKIYDVIEKLVEVGFNIVRQEIRQLSRDEVMYMCCGSGKQENMEEIITNMTSGKCSILALSCYLENPVTALKDCINPTDAEEDQNTVTKSLRIQNGLSGYKNGIYSSNSREEALKSISMAFPDLVLKKDDVEAQNERTVIIIPANSYNEHMKSILEQIGEADLKIVDTSETSLPKTDIAYIYKDIMIKKDLRMDRIEEMYGSKFNVFSVQNKNCIHVANYFLDLYEPEIDEIIDVKKLSINDIEAPDLIYTSKDKITTVRDLKFFFPLEITFAIIKPDAYEQRDEIIKLIKSAGFHIPIADDVLLSLDQAEGIYNNVKSMAFFQEHMKNMTSGLSLVMVLAKYNAIIEWRNVMGCVNPEEAAEQGPDKLRGIFGSTSIENALHGSSNYNDCIRCIKLMFGNVQFDERGNVCGHILPNRTENFPIHIYVPMNIDEVRIQDILKKLCFDKGLHPFKTERNFSIKQIAKLYSKIKCFESYTNLKCFIVIGGNIIPVIQNEETVALEKLEKINASSKSQKNYTMREDLWNQRFTDKNTVPETRYMIYKLDVEASKEVSVAEEIIDSIEM